MDAQDTLEIRRPNPRPENELDTRATLDSRLVSIDIATGAMSDMQAGPGAKFNPSFLPGDAVGYVRKDLPEAGIYYTSGARVRKGTSAPRRGRPMESASRSIAGKQRRRRTG